MRQLNLERRGRPRKANYWSSVGKLLVVMVILTIFFRGLKIHIDTSTALASTEQQSQSLQQQYNALAKQDQQLRQEVVTLTKQASLPLAERMGHLITVYFPEDTRTALAVFKAESGLNPETKGWNCYFDASGQVVSHPTSDSRSCPKANRTLAWSVDCGLTQLNFLGQDCPEKSFDPEWNLEQARDKYLHRGWQPWVAHENGSYLKYLASL